MTEDKAPTIHGDETGLTEELADITDMLKGLGKLREPFPEDKIEKLPKPKWKNAWEGKRGSHCEECHGYHVLEDCIHLDYVGHAQVTNRLLDADPFWSWEPLAWTEQGTPLFNDGGLWIKLTVCGVERYGFGDGKSVKEIIGDAIRNAAMRFGVALNLWAKIDLHSERNPGDGEAPERRQVHRRDVRDRDQESRDSNPQRRYRQEGEQPGSDQHAAEPPRAPNQDALDALGEICDENGIPRRGIKQQYLNWATKNQLPDGDLLLASADDIGRFILHLLESMEPPDDSGAEGDTGSAEPGAGAVSGAADASGGDSGASSAEAGADGVPTGVGEVGSADDVEGSCAWCGGFHDGGPENCTQDTSDVEKKEGDLF